jgi:N-acetyl-gamma-glutamyl-phosphate reductase
MIRVGIAGASGYTGFELIRLLNGHPEAGLAAVTSRGNAGVSVDDAYPALRGHCALTFREPDAAYLAAESDVVITALPHRTAMEFVPELLERNVKVVDLSADYRFRDASVYESWYQAHRTPDLLVRAVYGLPELYREEIAKADLVGNPGCYPTSVILGFAPVLKAGLVRSRGLVADSKSGVSGAGRGLSLTTHFCEANENFKAYKVGEHRHTPEMEQELGLLAGEPLTLSFTPHLLPVTRGILSTLYAELNEGVDPSDVDAAFRDFYRDAPFVRLSPSGGFPSVLQVRGSNYCDLGWRVDPRTGRLVIVSAIDNLTRGASSQALCNMNLMFGLEETAGLLSAPWQP